MLRLGRRHFCYKHVPPVVSRMRVRDIQNTVPYRVTYYSYVECARPLTFLRLSYCDRDVGNAVTIRSITQLACKKVEESIDGDLCW